MEQKIHQIYDKVFKKILTLSSKAVINLINGLFDTDYPTNSRLHYNWTEFVNGDDRRRMVILIPFELLKLRKELEKERSPENREAMKKLIQDDIIGSIEKNLEAGNITGDDARRLKELTMKLYRHIYAHYNEMGDVSEMVDESLMLEYDIIEKQHQKELEEAVTEVRAEKDKEIKEKEKEIMILKKKLEEMERSKSKS